MIKVSVIIPAYNAAETIEKSINSVLKQSLSKIEIIIVDDGSVDNTSNLINEFMRNDKRINLITQANQSVGIARTNGLYAAKGEYISFLDSDDTFENDMLLTMYNKAKEENYDIVICNYNILNQLKNSITKTSLKKENCNFSSSLNLDINPATWNKLYKRELFIKNKIIFTKNIFCEDLATTLELFYFAKKIGFVDKALYNYYIHPKQATRKINEKYILDIFVALQRNNDFLLLHDLFGKYKKEFLQRFLKQILLIIKEINNSSKKDELFKYLNDIFKTYNFMDLHKKDLVTIFQPDDYKFLFNLYLNNLTNIKYILPNYEINILKSFFTDKNLFNLYFNCYKLYKQNIQSVYIYGSGDIFESIIKLITHFNIKVAGIIETNPSNKKASYKIGKLENYNKELDKKHIIIASIASKKEIINTINIYSKEHSIFPKYISN